MSEKLAVNLIDLDRLPPLSMEKMILPYTIKKAIQCGQTKEDVGIEFNCDLLQAAVICDMIRSEDHKSGDTPTRLYLFNGSIWKRLSDEAVLTRVSCPPGSLNGPKISLHPQVFDVPTVAMTAPPPPRPLNLGKRVGK